MHLVVIGGSDAGISAALRAQELEPAAEITVLVADDYPNFSICGLPYFLSGETPDWRALAHRSKFPGLNILRRHVVRRIDASNKTVSLEHAGQEMTMRYDRLVDRDRRQACETRSRREQARRRVFIAYDG
jgi:NADPH-dependent 2,4-dienoyl-CoA reductase/sulfur reductase-like enzyme